MPFIALFVALAVIGWIMIATESLLEVARRIDEFVPEIGGGPVPATFGG